MKGLSSMSSLEFEKQILSKKDGLAKVLEKLETKCLGHNVIIYEQSKDDDDFRQQPWHKFNKH